MRILDRYVVRQLIPVWVWFLVVCVFLACLIDLFGHLDEILRYRIAAATVWSYYVNFAPVVFVRAAPIALLLSAAFVAARLSRHQELLAISASGTSWLRAGVPFLFVGWLASLTVLAVNDLVVPRASMIYERLRQEAFRGHASEQILENVAVMDVLNRLYHARQLDLKKRELLDLTVIEHDWHNAPVKNLYAQRAIWTRHGWLLLYGTIYRVGAGGLLQGSPEPFVERLVAYPVTLEAFAQPEMRPETMSYAQLRRLIQRLRHTRIKNVRRYRAELMAKLTLPFTNLVVCLIGFVGATQPQLRGQLRGLGVSLGRGLLYYLGVGLCQGIAKTWPVPVLVVMWAPHAAALWWCVRRLKARR
jgi:LPS export ABC transporter permease LptG